MIGQLVISKAGHDKGTLYMVYGEEGARVLLADGKYKTSENLKKKSKKHIQPTNAFVSAEISERIKAGEKVYPEEIKFEIKKYKNL